MEKTLIITQFVKAPIDVAFDTFTNNETYLKIFGVTESTVLKLGKNNQANTVGAIRKVRIGPLFLKEQVIDYERPFVWKYKFIDWSMPFTHLGGSMCFEEQNNGTLVTWDSTMRAENIGSKTLLSFTSFINENGLKIVANQIAKIAENKYKIQQI